MAERFLKFIPSEESMYLVRKHLKAFGLLTIIAERARRENGHPDGLTIGQCHLGDHKYYGLTEKEYRTAKKVLVQRGHIKIIETCRTRQNKKDSKSTLHHENGATERATKSTTIGTLVELCSTTVYDINLDDANQQKGDRKDDRRATEGRPKGDEQEGKRKKKKEKELPHTPSLPPVLKIKFRALVELTQKEHDSLLALHGEELLEIMLNMLNSYKGRKGVSYESDYYAMDQGSWVVRESKKDLQEQKRNDEKHSKNAAGGVPSGNTQSEEKKFQPGRVLRGSNDAGSLVEVGSHD